MTFPLSPDMIRRLSVDIRDRLEFEPIREDVTGKHASPYSKTDAGRKRRKARRAAIARKREFLA